MSLNSPFHPVALWHMGKHSEGGEVAEHEIFTAEFGLFYSGLTVTCGPDGACGACFIVNGFSFSIFLTGLFV